MGLFIPEANPALLTKSFVFCMPKLGLKLTLAFFCLFFYLVLREKHGGKN